VRRRVRRRTEWVPLRKSVAYLFPKIPRSHRWRVTTFGQRIMSTSVKLRQWQFRDEYAQAA
jgi:hypothetical protein